MAQNNLKNYVSQMIHGMHVRKHRKLILVINYYKGLASEYDHQDQTYLENRLSRIDRYYEDEVKGLKKRVDDVTRNDEKKEQAIKRYDEKAYWARRKYKTAEAKKALGQVLENILQQYDQVAASKRQEFINQLDVKYPHQSIENKQVYYDKIKKHETIKDTRKEKASLAYQKRHETFLNFQKKNEKRLLELTHKAEDLKVLIEQYNENKVKFDELKLQELSNRLESLKQNTKIPESLKERREQKLLEHIDLIQTQMRMLKDHKIHLAISNLKMYFGGVKAVNDLSFDVKKGEVFGLIGPNGAGKTTVFNCLTQFYKATGGNMVFRNKEDHLVNLYEKKTHDMIKEGIARSFQNVELIWELTVLDNLLVAAHSLLVTNYVEHMLHDRKMKREEKVLRTKGMQILTTLGIQDYAFRSPYGLPYGILKKIELARTLMTDPSLIILDEPAAGLNDAETLDLAKIIKAINKDYGITIFLVEHDMGLVMSICDTICAISFGKMIGIGTPKEIQNNPEVRKAYLGDDSDE